MEIDPADEGAKTAHDLWDDRVARVHIAPKPTRAEGS